MDDEARREIAVVGGGPVGAATALALARAGFRVVMVDRGPRPPAFDGSRYSSRVYALSPASTRFLSELGVWRAVATVRACAYTDMRVWVDRPTRGLHFAARELACDELGWIVERPLLVDRLWAGLEAAGVRCVPASGDARWEPTGNGGRLVLGSDRRLAVRLVIAADGADSRLRRGAGIDTIAWRYAQRAIVCNVETERPHQHTAWQRFLTTGPVALLPLSDGRSSLVWSATESRAQELMAQDDAAFCRELTKAVEALGSVTATTPRTGFPLRLQHARSYVLDGLALVGDAAHVVHPLAGQGVNLGLADAAALRDALVDARTAGRDWASVRTLRTYERRRRADNLEMLVLTDALSRGFRLARPGVRQVLGAGLHAVGALGPLKSWFAAQAAG
ncbi:MAG TPA: UbiH/UbiF/VisC/COQ6 family ubiquinone biosynthesis hydroxylase [Nevskiaceae bacterium]